MNQDLEAVSFPQKTPHDRVGREAKKCLFCSVQSWDTRRTACEQEL